MKFTTFLATACLTALAHALQAQIPKVLAKSTDPLNNGEDRWMTDIDSQHCAAFPFCSTDILGQYMRKSCKMEKDKLKPNIAWDKDIAKHHDFNAAQQEYNALPAKTSTPNTNEEPYVMIGLTNKYDVARPLSFRTAEALCGAYGSTVAAIRDEHPLSVQEQYRKMALTCFDKDERKKISPSKDYKFDGAGCYVGLFRVGCYEYSKTDKSAQYFWSGLAGCKGWSCFRPSKLKVSHFKAFKNTKTRGLGRSCGAFEHDRCFHGGADCKVATNDIYSDKSKFDAAWNDAKFSGKITSVNCGVNIPFAVKYVLCDNKEYWKGTRTLKVASTRRQKPKQPTKPSIKPPRSCSLCKRSRKWMLNKKEGLNTVTLSRYCKGRAGFTAFLSLLAVQIGGTSYPVLDGVWTQGKKVMEGFASVTMKGAIKFGPAEKKVLFHAELTKGKKGKLTNWEGYDVDLPWEVAKWDVKVEALTVSNQKVGVSMALQVRRYQPVDPFGNDCLSGQGPKCSFDPGYVGLPDAGNCFKQKYFAKPADSTEHAKTINHVVTMTRSGGDPGGVPIPFQANAAEIYRQIKDRKISAQFMYKPMLGNDCWPRNKQAYKSLAGPFCEVVAQETPSYFSYRGFNNYGIESYYKAQTGGKDLHELAIHYHSSKAAKPQKSFATAFTLVTKSALTLKSADFKLTGFLLFHGDKRCGEVRGRKNVMIANSAISEPDRMKTNMLLKGAQGSLLTFGLPITDTTVAVMSAAIVVFIVVNVAVVCYLCRKRIQRKKEFAFQRME